MDRGGEDEDGTGDVVVGSFNRWVHSMEDVEVKLVTKGLSSRGFGWVATESGKETEVTAHGAFLGGG